MRESLAAWNKIGPVVPRRGLTVVVTRIAGNLEAVLVGGGSLKEM